MKNAFIACLIGHLVLLVLASTNFTVISWMWGQTDWTWQYFSLSYRDGWGYAYVSEYSLGQVLCYIAAYALGVVAFGAAFAKWRFFAGVLGTILCLAGAATFTLEATHWLADYNFSLIASGPVAIIVLWIYMGIWMAIRGNTAMPLQEAPPEPASQGS
jgi:hypothetical protein